MPPPKKNKTIPSSRVTDQTFLCYVIYIRGTCFHVKRYDGYVLDIPLSDGIEELVGGIKSSAIRKGKDLLLIQVGRNSSSTFFLRVFLDFSWG